MAGNQIQFGIGFNVNEAGLNKLKQSLQEIQKLTAVDISRNMGVSLQEAQKELVEIRNAAIKVETALQSAFNTQLGTVNVARFNTELQKMNLPQLVGHFNNAGAAGQRAFNQLASAALSSNVQLKQTFSILENMKTTLANTIKWNIASSAINGLTSSVRSAFNYVKALDSSLTDIRIVTGDSREEMAKFAVEANNAAQALGRQTKEYTNAALSFYQQGLSDEEVRVRTEATLKAQNITGAGTELADELTAVWNGFKVNIEESELAVDKLAAVADSSASNMSELATGMSKTASVANNMGVSLDQLTAQLATIIATTRQAPESVGNALKTIYTRINDIKTGSDEAEISLGNYSKQMAKVGFSVLDANGNLRDTGEVIEEIGSRWENLSREQQIYLARTMAGQRQMNNLIALFDNWTKYSDMLNVSLNAEGALNEKNARYMESLSAHINQFKTAVEGLQNNLIKSDDIKKIVDLGTSIVTVFSNVTSSIGGAHTVLLILSSLLLKTFSSDIANGVLKIGQNFEAARFNLQAFNAQMQLLNSLTTNVSSNNEIQQLLSEWTQRIQNLQGTLSNSDFSMITQAEQMYVQLKDEEQAWINAKQAAEEYYNQITTNSTVDPFPQQKDTPEGAAATKQSTIEAMKEALKDLDQEWEQSTKAAEKYENKLKSLNDAQNLTKKSQPKDLAAQWEKLDQSIEKVLASSKKITDQDAPPFLDKTTEAYKKLEEAVAEFNRVKDAGYKRDTIEYQDAAKNLASAYGNAMKEVQQNFEKTGQVAQEVAEDTENKLRINVRGAKEAVEGLLKAADAKALMTNITNIVGAIGGIAGAIISLNNIKKLWSNDNLSSSEKLLRTLQSMAFVLPLLTGNITKFVTSIANIVKVGTAASGMALNLGAGFKVLGASFIGVEGAAAGVTASFASVAAAAGIVTVAIAAIGAGIYAFYQHYTRFDRAAKQAETTAQNLKTRATEAATAAQNLKSAFDDYNSLVEVLEGCVRGTEEWYTALENVNNKILEILNQYPQLLDYQHLYYRNAEGQLVLNPSVVERALNDSANAETAAKFASLISEQLAIQSRNISNQVDFERSVRGFTYYDVNKGREGRIGDVSSIVAQLLTENAQNLAFLSPEEYQQKIREILVGVEGFSDEWIEVAQKYSTSLNNLVDAQNKATQNMKNVGTIIASQYLKDTVSEAATVLAGIDYSRQAKQIADSFIAEVSEALTPTSGKEDAETFWMRYQLASGTRYQLAEKNAVQGNDAHRKFAYIGDDGETHTISAQEMANTIGAAEALENLSGSAEKATELLDGLTKTVGKTQKSGLEDWIVTGSFRSMSQADFEQLASDSNLITTAYLTKAFGINNISEVAETLGYESIDALLNSFKQSIADTQASFDDITKDLWKTVLESFNKINPKQFNFDTQTKIASLLTEAFNKGGKEGLDQLTQAFSEAGNQADILADILTNKVDWSTIDLETLTDLLHDAGIASTNLQEPLKKVIDLMRSAASINLEDTTTKYREALDVIDDLQYLDTISAKDYEKVNAFGSENWARDLFQYTSTGQYQFMGDSESLAKVMKAMVTDQLKQGAIDAMTELNQLNHVLEQNAGKFEELQKLAESDSSSRGRIFDYDLAQRQLDAITTVSPDYFGKGRTEELQTAITEKSLSSGDTQALLDAAKELNITEEKINAKIKDNEAVQRDWLEATKYTAKVLDEDIDKDQWVEFTKDIMQNAEALNELADSLKTDRVEAEKLSEAILRYDNAIQDITDNYEDWLKFLEEGERGGLQQVKIFKKMRDTYGDLLDLDGNAFSDSFIDSKEHLELLNKALTGTQEEAKEAYDELQQLAYQDFKDQIIKVSVDKSEAEQAFTDLDNALTDLNLDNFEIGMTITGQGDVIDALNNIISTLHLTEDQADALIGALSMDAEYNDNTQTEIEEQPAGYEAHVDQIPGTVTIPTGTSFFDMRLDSRDTTIPQYSYTELPPIKTEKKVAAPTVRVKNLKKAAGGNFKRASAPSGGGGGKKGGSGGGGGKQPKKTEKFKSKIDPYHDVNIKIGDVKEGLTKLEKQRDKLTGKAAIDNLTKQINLMEKQKGLLQDKAKIATEELQKQADELTKQGAIIDSEGNILNYKELLLAKQDQINKAIEIANGLSGEEQEAYLKYVDQLKTEYKELEEGIKNLDDTKQLLDDLGIDYQDIIDQQIEKAIEAFNLEIEVHLDMKDAKKEWNDFRKKVIEKTKDDQHGDLAEAAARNYSLYYNNEGTGTIAELQKHVQDIQREAEIIRNGGFSQVYGDNLAAATEDLKKYNDALMKNLEEAQDVINETHEQFLSAIEGMNEAFETQQENLDKLDDLLQHDIELLQLIHGEENYDEIGFLLAQQVEQDNRRLRELQKEEAYWAERVKEYAEGTEEWKKAMENWEKAHENTQSAMITAVKNLQTQWENSIKKIFKQLKDTTYGGNMEAALEDWDKMNWHSDRYLDSLERATGLLNLQDKYQKLINKTTNTKTQAELAKLEEQQLDALSQKEHLREIDLKLQEQQLAVLEAQIALEDAQQAKTKLRLRRDSQGNYTYQYVADEDDIAEKTQNYINALAEYRNMSKEALRDDLDELNNYIQEYYEKLYEAQMKYGNDTEAYMEEQKRLHELYMGEDGYITNLARDCQEDQRAEQEATYTQASGLNSLIVKDTFEKFLGPDNSVKAAILKLVEEGDKKLQEISGSTETTIGNISGMITNFMNDVGIKAFKDLSEEAIKALTGPEGLAPQWNSALMNIANNYKEQFVPAVLKAMEALQTANQWYVNGLGEMLKAANKTLGEIALGLYGDTQYTNALNEATKVLLETQDAQLKKSEEVYNALKKTEQAFKDQSEAAIAAANAAFLYWLALNGMTASGVPYDINGKSGVNISSPNTSSNSPSTSSGGSSSGSGSGGGSGDTGSTTTSAANDDLKKKNPNAGVYRGVVNSSSIQGTSRGMGGTNPNPNAKRYGSGGYTGEWNDDPRWALLDQKELVLNADDTRNVLSAVSIVRTIADKVASATNAAAANIGTQGLGSLLAAAGEQILQNVVINADFPAVQDAAQIKQAFNELVNLASQRVSTNRRSS